jgi:hypothetical protein
MIKMIMFWYFNCELITKIQVSDGTIWAYPGKQLNHQTICVMPEWDKNIDIGMVKDICKGICSDYVGLY